MSEVKDKKIITGIRTFKSDFQKALASSSISSIHTATDEVTTKTEALPTVPHTPTPKKQTSLDTKYKAISGEIEHVAKTQKYSILSDTNSEYEVNGELGGGVIIRDTKRKRFKLFPAIVSATKAWYGGVKAKQRQTVKVQTIANVESRIEVVEKAALGSLQAPKDDTSQIAEQVRTTPKTPISTSITLRAKEDIPSPSWTHIEEVDSPSEEVTQSAQKEALAQLEKITDTQQVVPDFMEEKVATVATSIILPVSIKKDPQQETMDVAAFKETVASMQNEARFKEPIRTFLPEVKAPSLPTLQKNKESILPPIVTEPKLLKKEDREIDVELEKNTLTRNISILKEELEEPKTLEVIAQKRIPTVYAPPREEKTSSRYFYILIAVIVCSSILGIAVTYYFYNLELQLATQGTNVEVIAPPLVKSESLGSFELPQTADAFITSVQKKTGEQDKIIELKPKVISEQGERDATTAEILAVLDIHAPGSFTRSITEMRFGGLDGRTAFIVIKTTSFDSAFAGILMWEKTLISDLAPLFGTATVNQGMFKDTIAVNKNVRLLVSEDGEDALVYTFKDQNTLVITQSRKVLERLLPLVE